MHVINRFQFFTKYLFWLFLLDFPPRRKEKVYDEIIYQIIQFKRPLLGEQKGKAQRRGKNGPIMQSHTQRSQRLELLDGGWLVLVSPEDQRRSFTRAQR